MKKILLIAFAITLIVSTMVGCDNDKTGGDTDGSNQTLTNTAPSSEATSTPETSQNTKIIETRVLSVNCPDQWDKKQVERKVEVAFLELYKIAEGKTPAISSQIEITYEPTMDWQTQYESAKSMMQNIHKDSTFDDIEPITAGEKTYHGFQGSGKVSAIYLYADSGTGSCNVFLDLKNGSAVNDGDILSILASIQIK